MGLGILCLETYWSNELEDRRTVRGLLDVLEQNVPGLIADHRHVADRRDVQSYLEDLWPNERYDLLYVAAHGAPGAIADEYGVLMEFDWLARRLEGSCAGRVVFLAGCNTVKVSDRRAANFLAKTSATALVGYTREVDWLESAQMDLIVLATLAGYGPGARGRWEVPPKKTLEKIESDHEAFVKSQGWRFWATEAAPRRTRRQVPDGVHEALEELLRIAEDESVDAETRIASLRAVGQLRTPDRRIAALARDKERQLAVRKAAVATLKRIDKPASRSALANLRHRIERDVNDPGRRSLTRALAG